MIESFIIIIITINTNENNNINHTGSVHGDGLHAMANPEKVRGGSNPPFLSSDLHKTDAIISVISPVG